MWDESGECEEITCPECGAGTDRACRHLLAVIDVTFGECEGGKACDYWQGYRSQVTNAMRAFLVDGATPSWERSEVADLWNQLQEEVEAIDDFNLPDAAFNELMISVLEEAGGDEHDGSIHAESGGRSESEMRILYAKSPKKVCEKATGVLAEWLKPLPQESEKNDRSH